MLGYTFTRIFVILLIFVFTLMATNLVYSMENEVRCGSVDIRNDPRNAFHQPRRNMKTDEDGKERKLKYRECTILEGDFTISMITRSNLTDDLFPVFENLREITGSILVFQIRGLTSLGRIFPNLRVIGGHSLIMNYALVVYQNYDLRDIGLTKLVAIKNGGVRITENPRLCYTRSISWKQILIGNIRDLIIDQVAGHCKNDCPTSENDPHCFRDPFTSNMACWNNTHCQRICINNQKTLSGCTINDELCHEECIGGCTRPNDTFACFSCRHLDLNGQCVSKCPDHLYEQLGRRCLTKYECEALYPVTSYPSADEKSVWKAFKKHCSYECPNGYREDPSNSHSCIECINFCPKKCPGDTVDSISSALKFSKCNMIEGNLEIDMRIGIESTSAEKFTEAFGEIEEITGYLLIRFSSAFMSLHMFKKLRRIHGQQLWKNLYALVVFENQNLRQLFNVDEEHKIEILRGKISFQNNRMLCYDKIKNFIEHLGMKVCTEFGDENNKAKCVGESDVSPFSNGDKAICDEIPLEVKIVSVYSYGFVITWTPFNTTDMDHRKFLGYMIFYKKVDKINLNMTIDDDRSACSDSWSMYFVTDGSDSTKEDISGEDAGTSSPKGELINQGVEANTLYAVYVQTRVVNHPGAKNAISPILYVKTLFGVPDPPRMRASIALSPNSIKLNWDPPLEAYGDITHYMVSWNLAIEYNTVNADDVCDKRINTIVSSNNIPSNLFPPFITKDNNNNKDTCSAKEGCCKCSNNNNGATDYSGELNSNKRKKIQMIWMLHVKIAIVLKFWLDNALQNTVFVQNCDVNYDPNHCTGSTTNNNNEANNNKHKGLQQKFEEKHQQQQQQKILSQNLRYRRHNNFAFAGSLNTILYKYPRDPNFMSKSSADTEPSQQQQQQKPNRTRRHVNNNNNKATPTIKYYNSTELNVSSGNMIFEGINLNYTHGKMNVTGTNVYACQNISAPDNYCSGRPAWTSARTLPIPENDMIDPNTILLSNSTTDKINEKRIYWEPPEFPNGFILAFRAKLTKNDDSTPYDQCITFERFINESGVTFSGIADGLYTLHIRTETSALIASNFNPNYTIIKDLFEIRTPSIFTFKVVSISASIVVLVLIISGIVIYYFVNRMFGKKVEEYWRQTISANPEYLSQMELYKADEWELKRDDIILEQEIGRGTFGKVFRGYGKNVRSIMGETFGDCAVKTVPETASNAERLHFLIEASVMKQFNTSFIVKLYGVVSDGQPVLVVMELMEKGNLRDFLRSHRPGAEENKENRPLPTANQYFNWAAQIADGMAYLESLKFCHRDLAARNCMVHANESVKIGDFGMARDIYYHEYYKPAGKRLMPVRWMAPESLKDGKFTLKSDVWSYGIVLYEMLTLGQQPYAGLGNDQVFNYTGVQRHVLNKPTGCPDFWYGLMLLCWKYDPRERPTFRQIVRYIENYASDEFVKASYVLNNVQIMPEAYNFDIDLDDEIMKRNVINEEFVYGQEEEDGEDLEDVDIGMVEILLILLVKMN
uniref:receptor protein-tyrosine kinase n=1 Tax=Meloidogyne enterolobii TaxID=390850 RepID=A0A6V7U028_MELEN|nr:unnamed protein product [Meloidogyne enterolobii]